MGSIILNQRLSNQYQGLGKVYLDAILVYKFIILFHTGLVSCLKIKSHLDIITKVRKHVSK